MGGDEIRIHARWKAEWSLMDIKGWKKWFKNGKVK